MRPQARKRACLKGRANRSPSKNIAQTLILTLVAAGFSRQRSRNSPRNGLWEEILPEELDAIDVRILDLLQHDSSLSIADIAERVGLSSSPAWRRIERLKKTGVIVRQVMLLDPEKLGLKFEVIASVKLQLPTRENLEKFEAASADWPEIVDCATVTGAVDYMLRVITRDIHAYDDFLRDKMLALGLVSDVQSRIVIRVSKRTTAAPLELAPGGLPQS